MSSMTRERAVDGSDQPPIPDGDGRSAKNSATDSEETPDEPSPPNQPPHLPASCLEDHVCDNHEWLIDEGWGGERWQDESYVEHEHQKGVKEDRRTQGMQSFKEKQVAQMKSSHRSSNADVQEASVERKREAKERPGAQTSKKAKVKDEYRKKASDNAAAEPEQDE